MFIVFEGGEGSGKSTQAKLLYEYLKNKNINTIITREPGGTDNAEAIRNLFVQGDRNRWLKESELFLVLAARIDHWSKLIKPHLDKDYIVICDRFSLSTFVYQGFVKGIELSLIQDLHNKFLPDALPDRSYVFQIDPEIALMRSKKRLLDSNSVENRFENLDLEFHKNIAKGFMLLSGYPGYKLINAFQDETKIYDLIKEDILEMIDKKSCRSSEKA